MIRTLPGAMEVQRDPQQEPVDDGPPRGIRMPGRRIAANRMVLIRSVGSAAILLALFLLAGVLGQVVSGRQHRRTGARIRTSNRRLHPERSGHRTTGRIRPFPRQSGRGVHLSWNGLPDQQPDVAKIERDGRNVPVCAACRSSASTPTSTSLRKRCQSTPAATGFASRCCWMRITAWPTDSRSSACARFWCSIAEAGYVTEGQSTTSTDGERGKMPRHMRT